MTTLSSVIGNSRIIPTNQRRNLRIQKEINVDNKKHNPCYVCGHELIWGGDHDVEDHEEFTIVTNLSCPNCGAYVEVYWGEKTEQEFDENGMYK